MTILGSKTLRHLYQVLYSTFPMADNNETLRLIKRRLDTTNNSGLGVTFGALINHRLHIRRYRIPWKSLIVFFPFVCFKWQARPLSFAKSDRITRRSLNRYELFLVISTKARNKSWNTIVSLQIRIVSNVKVSWKWPVQKEWEFNLQFRLLIGN